MFAAEDAVANYVASCIPLELTGEERRRLEKKRTTNSEAYEAYLRGRYFWNERTGEGLKKGLDYFRRAIELDPSYAEAHVGIADSYAMLGLYTVLPPNEAFPQAKLAASKALQMDNSLAEAHATLGFVHFYYDWDGKAAEVEFQRALQEDPNYAMAHSWYAFDLAVMKRFSEAIAEATLAVRGDPLSPIIITNAAWVHFLVGQYSQAIDLSKQAIEIDPNFPRAHYRLGNVYEQLGLKSLAIAEYRKAVSLSGGDTYYEASLGHAYGLAGQESDAVKVLRELRAVSKNRYVAPYAMALVYMGMRDNDRALDWLQRASDDHSTSMAYLTVDPSLSTLRSNPDFETLLRRTNF
jgi:tetratricopeptide (TPR) repeat protein